jgi:hypothetical protein
MLTGRTLVSSRPLFIGQLRRRANRLACEVMASIIVNPRSRIYCRPLFPHIMSAGELLPVRADGPRTDFKGASPRLDEFNRAVKRDPDEILKAALALPSEVRSALARALLESMEREASEDAEARRRFERARDRALKRLRAGLDLQWVPVSPRDEPYRL